MNYQEFDEEPQFDDENIYIHLKQITEMQLQQILQLNKVNNIPLVYAVYFIMIEKKQFQNSIEVNNYYQNLQQADHIYTVYNSTDSCTICNKNRENHLQTSFSVFNISPIVNELQEQIKFVKNCLICFNYVFQEKLAFFYDKTHDICTSCFQQYLEVQVKNGKVTQMKCPHCDSQINEAVISKFAPTIKKKFQRFLKNYEIATSTNKFWCPNVRCQNIIEFNDNNSKIKCIQCQTMACTGCRQLDHSGLSCEEYFQQITNDWQLEGNIKKCPQCNFLSQKLSGCDLMTCYYCKVTWCWVCGQPATYAHFLICPSITPGLNQDGSVANYFKLVGWYLLILFVTFIILIVGPTAFLFAILDKQKFYNESPCVIQCLMLVLVLLIGTILTPLFIFFCLLAFIPVIIYLIVFTCRWRNAIQNFRNRD